MGKILMFASLSAMTFRPSKKHLKDILYDKDAKQTCYGALFDIFGDHAGNQEKQKATMMMPSLVRCDDIARSFDGASWQEKPTFDHATN
jgi:hypothetical protein